MKDTKEPGDTPLLTPNKRTPSTTPPAETPPKVPSEGYLRLQEYAEEFTTAIENALNEWSDSRDNPLWLFEAAERVALEPMVQEEDETVEDAFRSIRGRLLLTGDTRIGVIDENGEALGWIRLEFLPLDVNDKPKRDQPITEAE